MTRKAFLAIPILTMAGCMATQNDMLLLQSQIDDLNSNLSTMQKNQADLALKIDNLNASLNASSENMKDLSLDISKLSAKIDEYGSLTDRKINYIGQTVKKQQEDVEKAILPSKLYSSAVYAYSSSNKDEALRLFTEYLAKYPEYENADNAYYYSGEILFEKKNYEEAAIFYAKILEKYPNYLKTPSVRLKYAQSLLAMKNEEKKKEAIRYLKSLVKDFPTGEESRIAKDLLKKEGNQSKPQQNVRKPVTKK